MLTTTRRVFLGGSLAALLEPGAAFAQPTRSVRLGLLASSTAETFAASLKIFRRSLQELGRVEGQNLTIEARYPGTHYDRLPAFVVAADPMLFSQRRRIVELAARHRLPAVYEYRLFAELGGLLSYGPDAYERFRRTAVYVDRILRGARPGDLPVEQPSTFELVLNLATADRLRLAIPPSVRVRADHVIE